MVNYSSDKGKHSEHACWYRILRLQDEFTNSRLLQTENLHRIHKISYSLLSISSNNHYTDENQQTTDRNKL